MNISKILAVIVVCTLMFNSHKEIKACSMYKITVDGKTMVGCNEDAWRTSSRIWFENAGQEHEYGAAFSGSREVGPNRFAPQSGMNEAGLTFSRLASYFPDNSLQSVGNKEITNEVSYLSEILHKCATVADVKNYIEQYDRSYFIEDVFIYVDSTGKYLVVEPYSIIEGENPYYVLSNFCPSITDNEKARKLVRYRNGEDFLSNKKLDASLSFCKTVSDTMHVCRKRNGDGTLLTSIWDTKNRMVNLYFYHNYDTSVQFSLSEELLKGDHILDVSKLFSFNPEFDHLANYKTPFNTPRLRILLVILGGILTMISLFFLIHFLRNMKTDKKYKTMILFAGLNILLTAYLIVLVTNINVYYFDAPYKHYNSDLISLSSYIPFILLLAIMPLGASAYRYLIRNNKSVFIKSVLVFNSMIYLISILGFGYWGLFDIFN